MLNKNHKLLSLSWKKSKTNSLTKALATSLTIWLTMLPAGAICKDQKDIAKWSKNESSFVDPYWINLNQTYPKLADGYDTPISAEYQYYDDLHNSNAVHNKQAIDKLKSKILNKWEQIAILIKDIDSHRE